MVLSNNAGMPGVEEEGGHSSRNDADPSPIVPEGEGEEGIKERLKEIDTASECQEGGGGGGEGGGTSDSSDSSPTHVNGASSSTSSTPSSEAVEPHASPTDNILTRISDYLGPKIMVALKVTCLLMTAVIIVQSRSPLLKSSTPFFPRHSLVSDFYQGDVGALTERLLAADLSFVVYYAPWDRESQNLRLEIEKVARYHHEQVYFAAINCWHPRSECKTKYKIRTFPALILHVRSLSGLETKAMAYGGPKDAGHIIRFLSRSLRPLSHVNSSADLARLQMEHSAVVLGYYEFTTLKHLPKGFNSFYLASLRALQFDNSNSIAWGVVTNPRTARALSFNVSQSVHIVLWNTTLVYTAASTADSEGIVNWALKRFDETATWVDIPGTKSLALNKVLQDGPALIVFTPDNPYYSANDPFTLLREVSLDYSNCKQSVRVSNLSHYLGSVRSRARHQLRQAERICRSYLKEQLSVLHLSKPHFNFQDETCCQTMSSKDSKSPSEKSEKICDVCIHASGMKEETGLGAYCSTPHSLAEESDLLQHVSNLMAVFSDSCREMMLQYTPRQQYSVCCQRNNTSSSKTPTPESTSEKENLQTNYASDGQKDDRIEKLVAISAEDQCKRLFHGSLLGAPALLKDNQPAPALTGLGCRTNRSLAFVAIDSLHHKSVALRLGINMTSKEPPNTAAVIVDFDKETHFIMDANLSKPTLVNFILNYTNGLLDRKLVSSPEKNAECEPGQLCIKELNANNYLAVTQTPGQMVVVLHYSKTCAACTSVGHVFLSVANAARHLPNVTFARIDTLANILPWHLYFENLPSIIVHPHFRKTESRIYDSSHPLTPGNLLSFIIANLDSGYRLLLALSTCEEDCREKVLQAARITTTQLHHTLSTSTVRLQHLTNQISKLIPAESSGNTPHKTAHYHLLALSKAHLVGQIKKHRIKLVHLDQLNNLMGVAMDKQLPISSDLLKSMYYITKNKRNLFLKDIPGYSALHDEL